MSLGLGIQFAGVYDGGPSDQWVPSFQSPEPPIQYKFFDTGDTKLIFVLLPALKELLAVIVPKAPPTLISLITAELILADEPALKFNVACVPG